MAKVTVRFFKIEKNHGSAPDLDAALKNAFSSGGKASVREKGVNGDTLRLERLAKDNSFYDGEIVRKQTGDMPPEANDEGLTKLSVSEGGGIGHCIAFRYSIALQTLAIQFDNRAVSVNKFLSYLQQFDPSYDYRAEPIIRQDAWATYNRGLPTKFVLEVAQPQNLEAVEGDVDSVISSARTLAEFADSPLIYIEVRMGHRKGSLAKSAVDGLLKHFTSGPGGTEDVRKLSATSSNEDGSEDVNFLNDLLKERRDVEVPEGDPDGHYAKRQSWLATCFNMHFTYINKVFGGSGVSGI